MTKSRFAFKAFLTVCLVLIFGYAFKDRYRIGIDPQSTRCLNARVFLIDLKDRTLQKGNLYVIEQNIRDPLTGQTTVKRLVKRLAACRGDRLQIDEAGVLWINGIKTKDTLPLLEFYQRPIEDFMIDRTLGEDEWFFLGDKEPSNDSRYWRTARSSQIQGRAWILF